MPWTWTKMMISPHGHSLEFTLEVRFARSSWARMRKVDVFKHRLLQPVSSLFHDLGRPAAGK